MATKVRVTRSLYLHVCLVRMAMQVCVSVFPCQVSMAMQVCFCLSLSDQDAWPCRFVLVCIPFRLAWP